MITVFSSTLKHKDPVSLKINCGLCLHFYFYEVPIFGHYHAYFGISKGSTSKCLWEGVLCTLGLRRIDHCVEPLLYSRKAGSRNQNDRQCKAFWLAYRLIDFNIDRHSMKFCLSYSKILESTFFFYISFSVFL